MATTRRPYRAWPRAAAWRTPSSESATSWSPWKRRTALDRDWPWRARRRRLIAGPRRLDAPPADCRGDRGGDGSSRARGGSMRRLQTHDGLGLAQDARHLEDRWARRLAGERDASELREIDELEPHLGGETTIEPFEALGIEGDLDFDALDEGRVAGGGLRTPELRDGLGIVARGRLEVEGGLFHHLHQGVRTLLERLGDAGESLRVHGRRIARALDEGRQQGGELLGRRGLDPLEGEPQKLLPIEDGPGLADVREVEALRDLRGREDFLVAVRPAEAGEVVHEGAGKDALVAEFLHGGSTVPLGHLASVRSEDHGDVGEDGRRVAESVVAGDLLRRVAEVVVAADHVGDLHGHVVDHHAKVVGGGAIRTHEDPVVEDGVVKGDSAEDRVLHRGLPVRRHPQAKGVGLRGRHVDVTTGAGIAELLLASASRLPQDVQRLRSAATPVGAPLGEQSLGVRAIDVEALGLTVTGRRRPLVPVEPEPAHGRHDLIDVLGGGARAIRVLDAENEHALVVTGERPVEQGSASATHVEGAGGARGKANSDRIRHGVSFYRDGKPRAQSGSAPGVPTLPHAAV